MWTDFATAGHTSNWKSPLLSQHATAYALQVMQKSLYTDHKDGVITKGSPIDHPTVKSASPADDPTIVIIADSVAPASILRLGCSGVTPTVAAARMGQRRR